MACGRLIRSSTPNCKVPFQGGIGGGSTLTLILKEDIVSITKDVNGVITAITLKTGASAWQFSGFKQSLKPSAKKIATPSGQAAYQHIADYFVFDYSQIMKNNLQLKANGRYLGIYENAKQDADCFELMGEGAGMEVTVLERGPVVDGGAYKLQLMTAEGEFEAGLPSTIFSTDYATTKSLVDNLAFLATITSYTPLAAAAAGGTAITITGTNFYSGGSNSGVLKVEWVNNSTGAVVNQASYTVASNTSITLNTPAMAAGSYKLRITTIKGVTEDSVQNLIVT